jgi:hypothetical protein
MICIAMLYLEAILQSIISTIVFVCVRANNRSELLYRSQTTLQQELTDDTQQHVLIILHTNLLLFPSLLLLPDIL